MHTRFAVLLLCLALAPIVLPAPASAGWWDAGPALPALTGRVVDQAAVLPPARAAQLTSRLAALEARTGHQFVIVTVSSLNGQPIEAVGLRLGRTWGIGRKGHDDGVLLLVAPNEHKVRIEVGYGLERQLTDPVCAKIIRDDILPSFAHGDLPGGIERGGAAIIAVIAG